ncbi:hypothetical protein FOL47_000036 [Perkinsus chesapeaki]|uniref:DUF218 domain-containing protein n=1 Tax=Perkinsus chesapeaki TaxID=330153 RepID=A0A7J6N419_PERCH|nr:hypothetical protein FOL47_000036 [Perkinsus chesapeaki]
MSSCPFDLVIVLSGGLDANGEPHPWVLNRLDYAAEYFCNKTRYFLVTSRGTPHKPPPIDSRTGFPIDEALVGANYLNKVKGIPAEKILMDTWSLDTVGNAFFALVAHCQPRGFTRLVVITSEFHMDRSRVIFEHLRFALDMTDLTIRYISVPDVGMTDDMLEARRLKERGSLATLRTEVLPSIRTPEDVHRWVFENHKAYAFQSKNVEDGGEEPDCKDAALSDETCATY